MRYLLMKPSHQVADSNNEPYPDVLTMDMENLYFSDPLQYELTYQDILRLDLLFLSYYRRMDYMDIVLIYNNIGHRSELSAGGKILLPRKEELDSMLLKRKQNAT